MTSGKLYFFAFLLMPIFSWAQQFKKLATLGSAKNSYEVGQVTRFNDYFILAENDSMNLTNIYSINLVTGEKQTILSSDTFNRRLVATAILNNAFYIFINHKLYRTDGTSANTKAVANVPCTAVELAHYNNELYFLNSSDTLAGLWRSDGTTKGTRLLRKSNATRHASNLYVFKRELYYAVVDQDSIRMVAFNGLDSTSRNISSDKYLGFNETMPRFVFLTNTLDKIFFRSKGPIGLNSILETNGTVGNINVTFRGGFYGELFLDGTQLYLGISRGTQNGSFHELFRKDLTNSKIDTLYSIKDLYISFRDFQ